MSNFTIVIPNYNGATILQENLPKILTIATQYDAPIILIDDASTDNSVKLLQKSFQFLPPESNTDKILICKPRNEGFSSTVNLGVQYVTTPYVLLLNSDAVPQPDAPAKLLAHFSDPQVFSVGMQDIDEDSKRHGQGKFIWHQGFLLHQKMSSQISTGPLLTGWVSCGSGMFRKDLWDQLHGLNPIYNPFYFEDVDLGYRALKLGYQNHFEPLAKCTHLHYKGAIKSNYSPRHIRTISIRNQFFFNWLNLTSIDLLIIHICHIPYNLLLALKNRDWPFLQGFLHALSKIFLVVQQRTRSPSFVRSDNQILSSFKSDV
jgi:GT2 family glycosyltransferase